MMASMFPHQPATKLLGFVQKLDDKSKERLGFERELYKYLDKLMLELASKIRRNTDRLAAEEAAPLPPADQVCQCASSISASTRW